MIFTEELGFPIWHLSRCTFEDLAAKKIFNDYLGFDFTMLSKGLFFCLSDRCQHGDIVRLKITVGALVQQMLKSVSSHVEW